MNFEFDTKNEAMADADGVVGPGYDDMKVDDKLETLRLIMEEAKLDFDTATLRWKNEDDSYENECDYLEAKEAYLDAKEEYADMYYGPYVEVD